MSDFDSQNDELLVLESIYPETFSKHLKSQEEEASSSASSLNSGQVWMHLINICIYFIYISLYDVTCIE